MWGSPWALVGLGVCAGTIGILIPALVGPLIIIAGAALIGLCTAIYFPAYLEKLPLIAIVVLCTVAPFDTQTGSIYVVLGRLTVADVFLALAVLMALPGWVAYGRRISSIPLNLFLGYTLLSCAYSVSVGTSVHNVLYEVRPLAYYSLAGVLTSLRPSVRDTRFYFLLTLGGALAASLKALAIAIFFPGLAQKPGVLVATVTRAGAAIRVVVGSSWAEAGFLLAFPFVAHSRSIRLQKYILPATAILLGAIVISYTRTIWLSVLLAVLLCLPFLGFDWLRSTVRLALLSAACLALLLALEPQILASVSSGVLSRLSAVNTSRTLAERAIETGPALAAFRLSPILGAGLGHVLVLPSFAFYGFNEVTGFIHNGFLFVLTKEGVVGLALFTWLLATATWRAGWTALKSRDVLTRLMASGCLGGLIAFIVTNNYAPFITESVAGVVAIALMIGITDRLRFETSQVIEEGGHAEQTWI
jgi:hypothetical protein